MIHTERRTEKEWVMTAKQATALGKELIYIAEEANDHRYEHYSQMISDGGEFGLDKIMRIIAMPDKKEEKEEE